MFYSTFFCWYHDQVLFCSFEFLILFLAKNALLDKNARSCWNEGSTSRGSCFRWWELLLFFIKCWQIFSLRFHECSESTVAVHVITATLVYESWDANIHIFFASTFLPPEFFCIFPTSHRRKAKSVIHLFLHHHERCIHFL